MTLFTSRILYIFVLSFVSYSSIISQEFYEDFCTAQNKIYSRIEIDALIEQMHKQDLDSVLVQNKRLYCRSVDAKYPEGIAEALNNIGYYYYAKHDVANSGIYLTAALKLSQENKFSEGIAAAHCYYGLLNEQIQNYENAMFHYKKVYELGVSENSARWHGDGLVNIGKIHLIGKNYVDAEKYFLEAIEVFKPLGTINSLGWAHTHLGKLKANIGEIESAYHHLKLGQDIMVSNKNYRWISYMKNEFGDIYKKSDPQKSFDFYKEALELNKKNEFFEQTIISLYNLGLHYMNIGDEYEARKHFLQTFELSHKVEDLTYLELSSKELANMHEKNGNLSEAIKYYKLNEQYKTQMLEKREKESSSWLSSERKILNYTEKNILLNAKNQAIAKDIAQQKKTNLLLLTAVILFLLLLGSLAMAFCFKK